MYAHFKYLVLILAVSAGLLFSPRTLQISEAQTPPGRALSAVWAIVRTGTLKDAGTDNGFQLVVQQLWKSDAEVTLRAGNYSWDENERGRTETYAWNLRSSRYRQLNLRDDDFIKNVCIETLGRDAWFVQSIWIFGRTTSGRNVTLAANPYFNAWLSRDSKEGKTSLGVNSGKVCLQTIF